jgi:hypothetical protein
MKLQNRTIILGVALLMIIGVAAYFVTSKKPQPKPENTSPVANSLPSSQTVPSLDMIKYTNTDYGFEFTLPPSWAGYSIVNDKWEGDAQGTDGEVKAAEGPKILIRHPDWTAQNPRQDIPIMIFTIQQWNDMQQDKFHIGAAPINPSELGRNAKYVFALPARYNFAFPTGYEEVEKILEGGPLRVF